MKDHYFSGRFFYKPHEGRFNSASYAAFLLDVLGQTRRHVVVMQDGARYHTSAAMQTFFKAYAARLTIEQLPSYSPDFNPIEHLWKKVKKRGDASEIFSRLFALASRSGSRLVAFCPNTQ